MSHSGAHPLTHLVLKSPLKTNNENIVPTVSVNGANKAMTIC